MVVCASGRRRLAALRRPPFPPPARRTAPSPKALFRRYLTQDYLFLIHFARSYALLVSKLRTLAEMRAPPRR
jgi:hypothetical protein